MIAVNVTQTFYWLLLQKNMNSNWPTGRCWVQFFTVFISLGISELADFFCFLSIHLYTDQIFYHGYLYLHGF